MKLNNIEKKAFADAGAAICGAKINAVNKKEALKLLTAVLADEANRKELLDGLVIGDYKFKLVQRDELTAVALA